MKLREEEFYEQYHQHGGTTIIPTEIFNELYDDATEEIERLNNIINELKKYCEEEKDRLARETSNIYEDGLGKTRLVNEDIFNEIILIQDKIMELKGSDKE